MKMKSLERNSEFFNLGFRMANYIDTLENYKNDFEYNHLILRDGFELVSSFLNLIKEKKEKMFGSDDDKFRLSRCFDVFINYETFQSLEKSYKNLKKSKEIIGKILEKEAVNENDLEKTISYFNISSERVFNKCVTSDYVR